MSTYNYVSVDRIFAKLGRDTIADIPESHVIEWVGEALEFMEVAKGHDEAVCFAEVKNFQATLPRGIHAIIQVARNNNWTPSTKECLTPKIVEDACNITLSDKPIEDCNGCANLPGEAVWLDCNGKPIVAYDVAYYRPYFDLLYEYNLWTSSGYYRNNYTPVRLANGSFFNSIVCKEHNQSLYNTSRDQYTVIDNSLLRVSFETGSIAVAHLKQKTDPETGYPMIPDSISHTTAIVEYIKTKVFGKQADEGRQGSEGRLARAETRWDWYCGQAKNNSMMPSVDEQQNLLEQRSYLVPQQNRYYGFFGNLNLGENSQSGGYNRGELLRKLNSGS